jgi:hypothetical protein
VTARPALHELLVAALLAAGVAGGAMPHLAPRLPAAVATAGGLAAGVVLHRALAGRWVVHRLRRPQGGGAIVLAARAAAEEVAWRGFLLGALVPSLGSAGAVLLSGAVFACAHRVEQGRDRLVHLLTGSAFGLVYVGTGRLAAAVAAHVAYNALAALAIREGAVA